MKSKPFVLCTILELCMPVMKRTVLFKSFKGQYNDNPRYISEELHRRHPDYQIAWAIGDGKPDTFPEYVKLIPIDTIEYAKYIARAQIVVDNYAGCRTNVCTTNNVLKRAIERLYSHKRQGQMNLSTMHGTPLKKAFLMEPKYASSRYLRYYCNTNVVIAGCKYMEDMLPELIQWKSLVLMCGTPRNDILFRHDTSIIKKRLKLPEEKKVVLYAPTFRENINVSGIDQLNEINISELLSKLSAKFGGEWIFVFRAHNEVMKAIQSEYADQIDRSLIVNGNEYEDMAEYLACTDVLITDYSSCMFDYALTGRPCFIFAPDISTYTRSDRGFLIDIHSLPFMLSTVASGLYRSISTFDADKYSDSIKVLLNRIGNVESGNSAKKVVDYLDLWHLKQS